MPLQRTRSRALLGRSPLNGGSLGRLKTLTWLLCLLGTLLASCRSGSPPELLIQVRSEAGATGPFLVGVPVQVKGLDRASPCNDCFARGGTVHLLVGSQVAQLSPFGPFAGTGHTSVDGHAYCVATLALWISAPGTYRAELICPDGRVATSSEFMVVKPI
jgi:hypothetical protein